MTITFKLEEILEELEITKNHLAVETKTRPATVLYLAKGEIKRIDLEMISTLLDFLNKTAIARKLNRTYTIDSLLSYEFDKKSHQS